MDALSPARGDGLPEPGRVTAWELGARSLPLLQAQRKLCHSPAQVGTGNVASTQHIPEWVRDPAGLTWVTAGHVAGALQTLAPPAPCHTGWDSGRGTVALALPSSSSSSQSLFGTIPLVLEISSPMHTSPSPLILRAKSAWGSANPAESSPGCQQHPATLGYDSMPPHPTLQHTHCSPGWW